ncbi:MAG: hypothetical protein EHM61_10440 [Acidobacteria bacterium]|nr:MAG: hypothetical protein EHM61_10440 [Acidobacteriota bacterium]
MSLKQLQGGIRLLLTGMLLSSLSVSLSAETGWFLKVRESQEIWAEGRQVVPAKEEIHTIWQTSQRVRRDKKDGSVLLCLDKGLKYVNGPFGCRISSTADPGPVPGSWSVEETTDQQRIGQWNCQRYLVHYPTQQGVETIHEVWATADIPEYSNGLIPEAAKIKGALVRTVMTIRSTQGPPRVAMMKSELLEARQDGVPQGMLEPPSGCETAERE